MRRWSLAAAALCITLYAGFRLNECLGTDLVLALEPPGAALAFLHVLNSKRSVAVPLMLLLTLPSAVMAVRVGASRRTAIQGLVLLLVDYAWTAAIHIPLVTRLQNLESITASSEWPWLRGRYIADDVVRTMALLAASVSFVALATRAPREALVPRHGPRAGPSGLQPTD